MTADEFLNQLEKRSLLPADVLTSLRQQLGKSLKIREADSIAELLVSKKHLTPAQVEQILKPPQSAPLDDDDFGLAPLDEELMLAPLDDAPKKSAPAKPSPVAASAPATRAAPKSAKPVAGKPTAANPAAAKSGPAGKTEKPAMGAMASPLDDLLSGALANEALAGGPSSPLLSRRRTAKTPRIVWIGGGAAAILLIGIIALIVLTRSNGDPEWKLAEKDYSAGADQEAIYKLDAFVERFPRHAQARLATVYRGMAELRMTAAGAKADPDQTLAVAQRVLPRISTQPDFGKVRDHLVKILPDLADGLVKRAREAVKAPIDQRRHATQRAAEGLALVEDWRYILDSQRPWKQLQTLQDEVAGMSRTVNRDADRDAASTEIRAAIASGELSKAVAVLDAICEKYPDLLRDGTAAAIGEELTQAAVKLVKVSAEPHKAESKPRPSPILATITYAARSAPKDGTPPAKAGAGDSSASPVGPSVIAVVDRGAAYFVSTADGMLLGRVFIGLESIAPVAVEPTGRDFIVLDAVHRDLCRVSADGAALRWRQPLNDAVQSPPLVVGKQLIVATHGGRLIQLDLATGDIVRTAQFPIALRASPVASADGATLYLTADRDALFTVSMKTFGVTGALYLGHAPGAISLPPVLFDKYLVLADSRDWDHGTLRVIGPLGSGTVLKQVQQIVISGRISTPTAAIGQRLFVVTDGSGVNLFELSKQSSTPLSEVGGFRDRAGLHMPTYVSVAPDGFWLAGATFSHFPIETAFKLAKPDIAYSAGRGASFAPIKIANKIILGSICPFVAGVLLDCGDPKPQGPTFWRLSLGAPLAALPIISADGQTLSLTHSLAGPFQREAKSGETSKVVNGPALAIDAEGFADDYGDAVEAWRQEPTGQSALVKIVRQNGKTRIGPRLWTAGKDGDLAPDAWAQNVVPPAVAVGKNLLLATESGQLHLIGHEPEQDLAFQLHVTPGSPLDWRQPGVVPDKTEFIMADGPTRLIRLGIKQADQPKLEVLAELPLASPIVSPIAINGDHALATDAREQLVAFGLTDLKPAKTWPLGAPVSWGPITVGQQTLVATDREILCLDDKLELLWRKPLSAGPPVGSVATLGKDLIFASAGGRIWRVDRLSGEELAKLEIEQPLAGGPLIVDKTLVVVGADGCLHYVKIP